MTTGKNKEQFEKWFENYLLKQIELGNKVRFLYELPFEMQIGVYLAYYDDFGVCIEMMRDNYKKQYYPLVNDKKPCQFGNDLFETRNEAYQEAFKKANEIINNQ